MKNILKQFVLVVAIVFCTDSLIAQPKINSLLKGLFKGNTKDIFVGTVTAVNGNQFTCVFPQTGSSYVFNAGIDGHSYVESTKGGKYKKGTEFIYFQFAISDNTYGCLQNKENYPDIIARFPDGKSYLGNIIHVEDNGNFKITFSHSGSLYTLNNDGVVVGQSGGSYPKGTVVKLFCAETVGNSPKDFTLPQPVKENNN